MNLNATLLGQMITFALLIFVTVKYVWPPIVKAMKEREKKIAEGLEAGERGRHQLDVAKEQTTKMLRETKKEVQEILDHAQSQSNQMIDEAKIQAQKEGSRLIDLAKIDISHERLSAKDSLKQEFSDLVILGAKKVLEKDIDTTAHKKMLDQLMEEI